MLQRVLKDAAWSDRLTGDDRRALSPLFWTHVNPYGKFSLDMGSRLDLEPTLTVLSGALDELTSVRSSTTEVVPE